MTTLREAAQAVVDKAAQTVIGPTPGGKGEMVVWAIHPADLRALAAALAADTRDEVLDAAVLDAADTWERHCQLVGGITYNSQYVKAAALLDAVRARRRAQQEARDGSAV